jgi:hypothetical protein
LNVTTAGVAWLIVQVPITADKFAHAVGYEALKRLFPLQADQKVAGIVIPA